MLQFSKEITVIPPLAYDHIEVKNHLLSLMEWNESGKIRKVQIYTEAAHRWMEIGQNLGLISGVLESIKRDNHTDRDQLTTVLGEWMNNASKLPNSRRYPKIWSGLIQLLVDSDLADLADRVYKALPDNCK